MVSKIEQSSRIFSNDRQWQEKNSDSRITQKDPHRPTKKKQVSNGWHHKGSRVNEFHMKVRAIPLKYFGLILFSCFYHMSRKSSRFFFIKTSNSVANQNKAQKLQTMTVLTACVYVAWHMQYTLHCQQSADTFPSLERRKKKQWKNSFCQHWNYLNCLGCDLLEDSKFSW